MTLNDCLWAIQAKTYDHDYAIKLATPPTSRLGGTCPGTRAPSAGTSGNALELLPSDVWPFIELLYESREVHPGGNPLIAPLRSRRRRRCSGVFHSLRAFERFRGAT